MHTKAGGWKQPFPAPSQPLHIPLWNWIDCYHRLCFGCSNQAPSFGLTDSLHGNNFSTDNQLLVREWGGFLEVHPQTSTEQSLLGDLPTPKNSQASLWIILGDTKQSQNDPAQELLPKVDSHSLVRWGSHQKSPPISVYGHLKTKFPLGDFPISLTYTIRNSSQLPPTHLQDTVGGVHVKGNSFLQRQK